MSTCLKKLKRSALGKRFSGDLLNLMARGRKEKYLAGTVFRITRQVIYLNLIGQTNASIKYVPGTSQPSGISRAYHAPDIICIMTHHNVRFHGKSAFQSTSVPKG